jgi:hypothetical protein
MNQELLYESTAYLIILCKAMQGYKQQVYLEGQFQL